ncbi:MAG: hypothetical protein MJZ46_03375 [Bacteroidales bacterium]|nr:hypothetical protein [Bacteroidales bacterium]
MIWQKYRIFHNNPYGSKENGCSSSGAGMNVLCCRQAAAAQKTHEAMMRALGIEASTKRRRLPTAVGGTRRLEEAAFPPLRAWQPPSEVKRKARQRPTGSWNAQM